MNQVVDLSVVHAANGILPRLFANKTVDRPITPTLCINPSLLSPELLHFQTVFTLWLLVLDAHLLEEDIRAVVNGARITSSWTFLGEEIIEYLRLNLLAFRVRPGDFAAECCLSDTILTKKGIDLLAVSSQES